MLRLFVGGFLTEEVARHVEKHRQTGAVMSDLRWTEADALHVTLKFLGRVSDDRLAGLGTFLRGVALRHAPLDLGLAGGGAFPSKKEPRVFWTGVVGNGTALKRLASDIETGLEDLGFIKENRKFKPHITLAKPRGAQSSKDDGDRYCKLFENYQSPMFSLRTIHLIQSQLTSTGAVYTVLDSFPLGHMS